MSSSAQRHARAQALLTLLSTRYPVIKRARPLAEERVEQALISAHPDQEPWLIRLALHQHLTSDPYLQSLAHGGPRHDLDGHPCGEVDPDTRHHAHLLLKHHRAHRGG